MQKEKKVSFSPLFAVDQEPTSSYAAMKIKDIKLVATIEQMKEDTANEQLITKFLSKVNPTGWRTNRKAALIELEKALFYNKTQVCLQDVQLIRVLLQGSKKYPKGLLRICGEHSVSNIVTPTLTRASILALRLVAKLFDPTIYSGAAKFTDQLKHLNITTLALPNFAQHFIRENNPGESASELFEVPIRVITAFLIHVPNVPDDWARYFYLRQAVGFYSQKQEDRMWETLILSPNFSHSMVVEFLTTSKHRLPRETWIKNLNTYFTKCRPVLNRESIEILMLGISKLHARGLIDMCTDTKFAKPAKEFLVQLLDESIFSDAGRYLDFLLERKDLLKVLGFPPPPDKHITNPLDVKIYFLLSRRVRLGEVKDVLRILNEKPSDKPSGAQFPRDTSHENLKKSYGKMQRKSSSCPQVTGLWQGYPSLLSAIDEPPFPRFTPSSVAPSSVASSSTISTLSSPAPSPVLSNLTPISLVSSPTSPASQLSSSHPSPCSSQSSSTRSSDEYTQAQDALDNNSVLDKSTGPIPNDFKANVVYVELPKFFSEESLKFSRIEYRRLLIFLIALVTKNGNQFNDVDEIFEDLGLDSNPQFELSVSHLFETLEKLNFSFDEAVCKVWAARVMQEIASTERDMDS